MLKLMLILKLEIKPGKGFECMYNAGEIIKKSKFLEKYAGV